MLRDEVAKYTELSGNDGWHTPIGIIGAYLDGYEKGLESRENIKGEWIPVSERLPDETKTKGHGLCHVLVTHTYAGIIRTHQAVFTQGKFLKLETYKEDNTIVAWMPLPKPYESEKGGE